MTGLLTQLAILGIEVVIRPGEHLCQSGRTPAPTVLVGRPQVGD